MHLRHRQWPWLSRDRCQSVYYQSVYPFRYQPIPQALTWLKVCGPPKYAEIRINFSQAFNGIGAVVAPVLGSYVFFAFDDRRALQNVQWVYLAISVFVFCLAIVFYMSEIPEITDADMAYQAEETHTPEKDLPFSKQYRLFHAAFAQFCYCGAQVSIAG